MHRRISRATALLLDDSFLLYRCTSIRSVTRDLTEKDFDSFRRIAAQAAQYIELPGPIYRTARADRGDAAKAAPRRTATLILPPTILPPTRSGMTEAPTTRRSLVLITRSSRSTTRSGSWSGPMRQVPAGWCTVMAAGGICASSG